MTRLILPLFSLCLLLGPHFSASAQLTSAEQSEASLSPLEVIREIDKTLITSRIEANQAGRLSAFTDKVNMAKSFVHANQPIQAKSAYAEAVAIAWHRGEPADLMSRIEQELRKLSPQLAESSRPQGLDENYQPVDAAPSEKQNAPMLTDKHEACNKIDEALAFLYADVIKDKAKGLTLQGQMSDCRHLVEMEMFPEAEEAYHAAIIQYLDPRWTSQLLEEIHGILMHVEPMRTPSEKDPSLQLTKEAALQEMQLILEPLHARFAKNAQFQEGLKSMNTALRDGRRDEAMEVFRTAFDDFAPEAWLDKTAARFDQILDRSPGMQRVSRPDEEVAQTAVSALDSIPPILHFTDEMEGRVVERLRLLEANEIVVYKKVKHNWGGEFYFINDDPTKDTEWLRVWNIYLAQKAR